MCAPTWVHSQKNAESGHFRDENSAALWACSGHEDIDGKTRGNVWQVPAPTQSPGLALPRRPNSNGEAASSPGHHGGRAGMLAPDGGGAINALAGAARDICRRHVIEFYGSEWIKGSATGRGGVEITAARAVEMER